MVSNHSAGRMSRRRALGALGGVPLLVASAGRWTKAGAQREEGSALPRPTRAQLRWQDFELGIVFHFDLPVFATGGWAPLKATLDPNLYRPEKLDTDQWLEAAKAFGARYAIFTATHFNGFLQWQSDLYPYGLKQTSWRGGKADVFADFVASCHRYGIAPGVYLSCHRNAYWKVWSYRVNWGRGGEGQAEFARMGERMTEELVSRYGPLCEIWYDAGLLAPEEGGPDVVPIVEKHQPEIVFYHSPERRDHRWIGNERGVAGYPCWATMPGLETADKAHHAKPQSALRELLPHGDPNGTRWEPAMVDVPIRDHDWFWRPGRDDRVFSLEALVEMYYTSVGRNCNFIVGGVPDRDGLIPETDFRRYEEFGREIRRRFGKPVAETSGEGDVVELKLPRPARIDHVVIMEEIAEGERVRAYEIEAHVGADEWRRIAKGISVGHKRIERFPAVEAAAVRVRVTQSVAPVKIRLLAAYASGV